MTIARLRGKTALVTGGSRGIGASIAKQLAADGANIAVNFASNEHLATGVVAEIAASGCSSVALQADITSVSACSDLIERTMRHFGRLDILVNNAAIVQRATLDEIDEDIFDCHVATNLKAPLFLAQAAARVFPSSGASIINVSSIGTRAADPRFMAYSMTKAALEMLTVTMSRELGPRGIRVNAVAPGQIDTAMLRRAVPQEVLINNIDRISLGRLGLPDDIAPVVAFLASDDARWITGETIHVSGGQRL